MQWKNAFAKVCKSRSKSLSQDHSIGQRQSRSKSKNRKFNEVVQSNPDDETKYNDYIETKQEYDNVVTLYYHNVVIQASEQKCRIICDLKMTLGAKSCLNQCKVGIGVDGNLLPTNACKR